MAVLRREAERQLAGTGDASLGEWREWTGKAYHIRRRLTPAEEKRTGPVKDIRRSDEALQRAVAIGDLLIFAPAETLEDETGVTGWPFSGMVSR